VLALAVACQQLKVVAWRRPQVGEFIRGVEITQFPAHDLYQIGREALRTFAVETDSVVLSRKPLITVAMYQSMIQTSRSRIRTSAFRRKTASLFRKQRGVVAAARDAFLLQRAFALYRLREGEESPRRKAAMALFGYSTALRRSAGAGPGAGIRTRRHRDALRAFGGEKRTTLALAERGVGARCGCWSMGRQVCVADRNLSPRRKVTEGATSAAAGACLKCGSCGRKKLEFKRHAPRVTTRSIVGLQSHC
jgi:hypothetical protein